jgi:hypothetical protein
VQQPLAVQQSFQQPFAVQQQLQQPLGVQQAAQPIQALGTTGIATQGAVGQPIYQAQAAPVQGFSQQQFQQESRNFESNIPSAREAGNWNQLGEYGWYNQAGGQQISSGGQQIAQPMQQATGQQLYQAEPIVEQQGFSQQATSGATQQLASSTAATNLGTTQQGSNLGGYSWYNEQAGQTSTFAQPTGQGSSFAQPMTSSNFGQASFEPASMQQQASSINQPMASSSWEQQAISSTTNASNQPMGQATSELGRAATQSLEGSLSRGMQGGNQFLSSAAPVGTGAR